MNAADLGLLLIRAVVGLTFAAHGAQKAFGWWGGPGWSGWSGAVGRMGFRPATPWAVIAIIAELVGGLLLAVGLLTPLAAMALVGQSVVIIGKAHWAKGFWNRDGGFEFPLSLGAAAASIGLIGPGALCLDVALAIVPGPELRVGLVAVGLVGGLVAYATTLMAGPPPAAG